MPLGSLESSHAADFASHALRMSMKQAAVDDAEDGEDDVEMDDGDDGDALMMHEAIALQWIRVEELVSMSENFPSDLLEPLGPLTLSEVTFAAEDATAARMMPAPTSDARWEERSNLRVQRRRRLPRSSLNTVAAAIPSACSSRYNPSWQERPSTRASGPSEAVLASA